jgi:uncharacterized membrane protein
MPKEILALMAGDKGGDGTGPTIWGWGEGLVNRALQRDGLMANPSDGKGCGIGAAGGEEKEQQREEKKLRKQQREERQQRSPLKRRTKAQVVASPSQVIEEGVDAAVDAAEGADLAAGEDVRRL